MSVSSNSVTFTHTEGETSRAEPSLHMESTYVSCTHHTSRIEFILYNRFWLSPFADGSSSQEVKCGFSLTTYEYSKALGFRAPQIFRLRMFNLPSPLLLSFASHSATHISQFPMNYSGYMLKSGQWFLGRNVKWYFRTPNLLSSCLLECDCTGWISGSHFGPWGWQGLKSQSGLNPSELGTLVPLTATCLIHTTHFPAQTR